jgi:DNA-binding MarR family transcriptional regulator
VLDELARVVDEGRAGARRQPPPLTAEGVVGGTLGVIYARVLKPDSGALVELLNPLTSLIVHPYLGGGAARRELRRPAANGTRAPARRSAGLNPLEGLDTRVTYRTMRVLAAIGAEAGLSNSDVSERAGVSDQGQISRMLVRLTRLGLIENTGAGQAGGVANAWRLTLRGRELERAMRSESREARRVGEGARP